MFLPEARGPEGRRIYAIGDVHGCVGQLTAMFAAIEGDLAARPADDFRVVLVGDYVDRGPESGAVLHELLLRWDRERQVALLGNHDAMFLAALEDPNARQLGTWLANGGVATLASYGIAGIPDISSRMGRLSLHEAMREVVPEPHRRLLGALSPHHREGDYLFVHAGIRPGVPLIRQAIDDLIWIREPFLESDADHGVVVVHGHTPTERVAVRPNRIGIDTGAVYGGPLTCLVIEGAERRLLAPDGLVPLEP